MREIGPASITLVRHGESVGNIAEERAEASGAAELGLGIRDADVALSARGLHQAEALAAWVSTADPDWRPSVVFTSPYRRARQTAAPTVRQTGLLAYNDERLRERELGAFDGVTRAGMLARFPHERNRRLQLGKYYYRPPGGESWADVILRVRSFLGDLGQSHDAERVWVFSHRATVMAFRAVLERLPERDLLDIDRDNPIPNGSLTRYVRRAGGYTLETYADLRAQDGMSEPSLSSPDVTTA
jgi:broad specificity phosphatase PhoE